MKIFKKITALFLLSIVLSVTVASSYLCSYNVSASSSILDYVDNLTNYFLTVTGAVNKPSGHSTSDHIDISPVPSSSRNAIKQKITDLINSNGIYESNGQYIFTSSAMDELYYILNGNNNTDFRVVNDFFSFDYNLNNNIGSYFNSTVLTNIQSVIDSAVNSGKPYLLCCYGYYAPSGYPDIIDYSFYSVVLNDNFAFIDYTNTNSNLLNVFRDNNSNDVSLTQYYTSFKYRANNTYAYTSPNSNNTTTIPVPVYIRDSLSKTISTS